MRVSVLSKPKKMNRSGKVFYKVLTANKKSEEAVPKYEIEHSDISDEMAAKIANSMEPGSDIDKKRKRKNNFNKSKSSDLVSSPKNLLFIDDCINFSEDKKKKNAKNDQGYNGLYRMRSKNRKRA